MGKQRTSESSSQASHLADRHVFLLTINKPKKHKEASVYLQASHQAHTHRFKDLASAFAYLTDLTETISSAS